jgi:peptide/nickel transport system permease protein
MGRGGRAQHVAVAAAARVGRLLLTLFAVSTAAFLVTSLIPGNAAFLILGPTNLTAENIAAVEHELGVDEPLPLRYAHWLGRVIHGDFGYSFVLNDSVVREILNHLPVSLELIALSVVIALVIAVPLGVVSAYRVGRPIDRAISALTFGLLAVPGFVMALVLILAFAVTLHLLPSTGWVRFQDDPFGNLQAALLPALSLSMSQLAVFTRLMRSEMIATLQEDFIAMARAKGLPTLRILFLHAFKPSSFPLLTVVGIQIGVLISGTVIVESIFGLPGVGSLLLSSIYSHDYAMIQGVTLFVATGFVTVNFLVDALYAVLDPRVRRQGLAA